MDGLAHHVALWVIVAYLVAAIPVGVLLGTLRGVNIRAVGSGNIGATNAVRALGPTLGAVVLLLDVGKAALPVWLASRSFALGPVDVAGLAAVAMGAVVGHIFPVYLRFRGGKGVACAFGVFVVLDPPVALGSLVLYGQTLWLSRTSGLGSLTAVTFMVVAVVLAGRPVPMLLLAVGVALLIWVRHTGNIRRMIAAAKEQKRAASHRPPSG